MHVCFHLSRVTLAIAVVACLAACSSSPGSSDTGIAADASDARVPPLDTEPASDIATFSDVTDDIRDALSSTDAGGGAGSPCTDNADCASDLCLQLDDGEGGFCSDNCTMDADCPDGFECLTFTDSGTDAVQRCVPSDLCVDADDDGYGVGPGCDGRDCNDDDDSINPAADELCDGIDQDCDGRTDENPSDERRPCDTGFPGRCQDGTTSCRDALLFCEPVAMLSDEVCDAADNDCNGAIDDGGVCAGEPCCFNDVCEGVCAGAQLDETNTCAQPAGFGEEVCDGLDNDCDGDIDEDVELTFYLDADEDTFGDPETSIQACVAPDGYVTNADDCNDDSNVALPGGTEVCDDLDNDCDTEVDEGVCAGLACCWADTCEGVCATAVTDETGTCSEPSTYGEERCDGLDNDCDGEADEDYDIGNLCSAGTGACTSLGTTVCSPDDAGTVCNAVAGTGTPEVCDGVDNDCDGSTDEGNPGGGAACSTGQPGVCAAGIRTCGAGVLACQRVTDSGAEICDSLDNDCDGATDEGFNTGGACTVGTGACARTGTWICNGTGDGRICSVTAGTPTLEVCDGVDNDCDGSTDEGNPGGGGACATGQPGVCAAGTRVCTAGSLTCQATASPSAEVCDGVDNDCDGSTDEGNPGGGAACATGQPGVCGAGTRTCSAGTLTCRANVSPSAEICDGVDNDCDGSTDEGNPGGGGTCNRGLGECRVTGVFVCAGNGTIQCLAPVGPDPVPELCDGLDNDCDGAIDEDFTNLGNSCAVGTGACRRTGNRVCNGAQTGTTCSATAGSPTAEICGNGIDEDCNGADLECPSPCQGVTRSRVWVDTATSGYDAGFVSQIADLFEGGGRTVTRGAFLFGSSLGSYDIVVTDSDSLSSSADPAQVNAWIQAGGALFLANENPTSTQCNYLNSLVSSSGLAFSCDTNDISSATVDNRFNLLSGVSGNLQNSGNYLEVVGGGNSTRLAGRDTSNMVGRYAQVGCGSVILWGDVNYGDTGVYGGNTPQVWALFRDWLLDVP